MSAPIDYRINVPVTPEDLGPRCRVLERGDHIRPEAFGTKDVAR